jgi:hypothetical protein
MSKRNLGDSLFMLGHSHEFGQFAYCGLVKGQPLLTRTGLGIRGGWPVASRTERQMSPSGAILRRSPITMLNGM